MGGVGWVKKGVDAIGRLKGRGLSGGVVKGVDVVMIGCRRCGRGQHEWAGLHHKP